MQSRATIGPILYAYWVKSVCNSFRLVLQVWLIDVILLMLMVVRPLMLMVVRPLMLMVVRSRTVTLFE